MGDYYIWLPRAVLGRRGAWLVLMAPAHAILYLILRVHTYISSFCTASHALTVAWTYFLFAGRASMGASLSAMGLINCSYADLRKRALTRWFRATWRSARLYGTVWQHRDGPDGKQAGNTYCVWPRLYWLWVGDSGISHCGALRRQSVRG